MLIHSEQVEIGIGKANKGLLKKSKNNKFRNLARIVFSHF